MDVKKEKKKFDEEIEELKYCTIFKQYSNWLLNSGAFVSFRTIVPFILVLNLVICIILVLILKLFILSLTSVSVQNDGVFIVNFVNFLKLFFSNDNFISTISVLLLKTFFLIVYVVMIIVFLSITVTVILLISFWFAKLISNNYKHSK